MVFTITYKIATYATYYSPPTEAFTEKTILTLSISQITSEELVNIYINRVKEVNPFLNAVVEERFGAALDEAKATDRLIEDAKKDGTFLHLVKDKPLLGVPFTVKESCSLAGKLN